MSRRVWKRASLFGGLLCGIVAIWAYGRPSVHEGLKPLESLVVIPSNVSGGRWVLVPRYDDAPCLLPTPDKPVVIYAALEIEARSAWTDEGINKDINVKWPASVARRILPKEVLDTGVRVDDLIYFTGRALELPPTISDSELVRGRAVVVDKIGVAEINVDAR